MNLSWQQAQQHGQEFADRFGAEADRGVPMPSLNQNMPEMSAAALQNLHNFTVPAIAEYNWASAVQSFDSCIGGRIQESLTITLAEFAAGLNGKLTRFADADAFYDSEFFRPGIAWSPGLTNVKAQILAYNFDQRQERYDIINRGWNNGNWGYKVTGVMSGVAGGLLDPINLIPIGGTAVKGARLAELGASQLWRGALRSAPAYGALNLASSGLAAVDLNLKGEDIGPDQVALEAGLGTLGTFGLDVFGGYVGRHLARGNLSRRWQGLEGGLNDLSLAPHGLSRIGTGMAEGQGQAFGNANLALKVFDEQEIMTILRANMDDPSIQVFTDKLEYALREMEAGRMPQLGRELEGSSTLARGYDRVLHDPQGGPANEIITAVSAWLKLSGGMEKGAPKTATLLLHVKT